MKSPARTNPTIRNRKASFQYELLDQFECGMALTGSEVKSLRAGQASLEESYAIVRHGEVFLRGCNIAPYAQAVLHRREIAKLEPQVDQAGLTLIPIKIYFNERGKAKIILALGRGKKLHDKRETVKTREADREMKRAMARRR
jgi:SsrA-binding protein